MLENFRANVLNAKTLLRSARHRDSQVKKAGWWDYQENMGGKVGSENRIVDPLSRYVKGTLTDKPNVVGNFVSCTVGFYGGLKV